MPDPDNRTALILQHILDINHGSCNLTDEHILEQGDDEELQVILMGLLHLNEELQFREEKHRQMASKLKTTHSDLLLASRQAGMAEMATGILHDVGNVLNSVKIATVMLSNLLQNSQVHRLGRAIQLMDQHQHDLGHFITDHPQGKHLPAFLKTLDMYLQKEHQTLVEEMSSLKESLNHIQHIIRTQQSYARTSGQTEIVSISELLDLALALSSVSFEEHNIAIERDYEETPAMRLDKHRLLQVLMNLLSNARHALRDSDQPDKRILIRTFVRPGNWLQIDIVDNGIGIKPSDLHRLFEHGFTTKSDGNGFGLHSSANAAQSIGGELTCTSPGKGQGATFSISLPFTPLPPAA